MNIFKYIIFFSIIMFSCDKKIYLTNEEKAFNPYSVGDMLIFKSDSGEKDTLVVKEVSDKIFPDAPGPLKYYNESMAIRGQRISPDDIGRYITRPLIKIESKTEDSEMLVHFQITLSDAYCSSSPYEISEIKNFPEKEIMINNKVYKAIEIPTKARFKRSESRSVDTIYWANDIGYLKIISASKTWELDKHIIKSGVYSSPLESPTMDSENK